MSRQTQEKNMKKLSKLLSRDLGHIHGERESGPNGAKREFLHTGSVFMRALSKDLGFMESRVSVNKSGIACSGEIDLYGMWGPANGIYVMLEQMFGEHCIMYRATDSIKSSGHFGNHFLDRDILERGNYDELLSELLSLKKEPGEEEPAYARAG